MTRYRSVCIERGQTYQDTDVFVLKSNSHVKIQKLCVDIRQPCQDTEVYVLTSDNHVELKLAIENALPLIVLQKAAIKNALRLIVSVTGSR